MNSISEQILQAVELVVEDKVSTLSYDKTILATIISVVNADTGEYKIEYEGTSMSAFSADVKQTYKVDDSVYVTVPSGDFSTTKIITSKVSNRSVSQAQLTLLQNSIFEIPPSIESMYGITLADEVGVIAGAPIGSANSTAYVCSPMAYVSNATFQHYANDYSLLRIKASFMVRLRGEHSIGNYGLRVTFYTQTGDTVTCTLDHASFKGNPYAFSNYAEQEIIVEVQKGYLAGLKSIELFEEGFAYDSFITYDKNTVNTIIVENRTEPNIFVKDVSVCYIEKQDLSDGYYLLIRPLKGVGLSSKVPELEMQGRLMYEGTDMIDKADSLQWYVRDLSILPGDEAYSKYVGAGWRPIQGATEIALTIGIADVRKQEQYKLLAYYNDLVLTAEIEVVNLDSTIEYAIVQDNTLLSLTNSALVGDWYVEYPDGAYVQIDEGSNLTDIEPYLTASSITIWVEVRDTVGKLGTLSYVVNNSQNEEDITVAYKGDDTCRYDANGDITYEESEREHLLQASVDIADHMVGRFEWSWVLKDGTQISSDVTNATYPTNAQITKLWVDTRKILHYNYKQKYRVSQVNNSVCVRVVNKNSGDIYLFEKELLCLKDGDQGTNGTTYVAAVRPCDSSGNMLSGFQALRYDGGWQNTMRLRCFVYKDGERVEASNYKWTGYQVLLDGQESLQNTTGQAVASGMAAISASSTANELATYVTVQATVKDGDKTLKVYASYPINIVVGNIATGDVDLGDIPSYVKYTSSGATPSYYNSSLLYSCQGVEYNDVTSLNENLMTIRTDNEGNKYINPTTSFLYDNIGTSESNIAVLELGVPSGRIIHPIVMYLDTYGNEAINGWDGTALKSTDGYILAPQIGAGTKDSNNLFTGVVMGKDTSQQLVGLYGYQAGINTFGLKEDGTAFFGSKAGGGQITIDGNTATISGGNGGNNLAGMTITLADKNASGDTYAIKLGAGAFSVKYNGFLTATSGNIGGWTLTATGLQSSDKTVGMSATADKAFWSTDNFYVTKSGYLYCADALIEGEIKASSGEIAGWQISDQCLTRTADGTTITLGVQGDSVIQAGESFKVSPAGVLTCKNANIYGSINASYLNVWSGNIGGWTISTSGLSGGTLNCKSGNMGGWTIDSNSIHNPSNTTILRATAAGGSMGITTDQISISRSEYGHSATIGSFLGNNGSYVMGMQVSSNDTSLVLETPAGTVPETTGNIRLTAGGTTTKEGGTIYLESGAFSLNAGGTTIVVEDGWIKVSNASGVSGLYACFA